VDFVALGVLSQTAGGVSMSGLHGHQMAAMGGDVTFGGAALGGGQAGMARGIDDDEIFETHDLASPKPLVRGQEAVRQCIVAELDPVRGKAMELAPPFRHLLRG